MREIASTRRPFARLVTLTGAIAFAVLIAAACGGSGNDAADVAGSASVRAVDETTAADDDQAMNEAAQAVAAQSADEVEPPTRAPAEPPAQLDFEQVAVWGEDGLFDGPNQIDVGPDGNIYLTEFFGGRVFKFSREGEELARWGGVGAEPGQLQAPTAIAVDVDGDGDGFVAESGGHRVQKFTANCELVTAWGMRGSDPGQFVSAMGLDIGADGRVYVADFGNSRVQVFTTDGAFLFSFGSQGSEPGQFFAPIGLDLDLDGSVLVVDTGNARVQRFTPEGELLAVYDGLGLPNPQIISSAPGGVWYLADPREGRVVAFDSEGQRVAFFPLTISYRAPHGTATGLDGAVYLADTGNNVVRKFLPSD